MELGCNKGKNEVVSFSELYLSEANGKISFISITATVKLNEFIQNKCYQQSVGSTCMKSKNKKVIKFSCNFIYLNKGLSFIVSFKCISNCHVSKI